MGKQNRDINWQTYIQDPITLYSSSITLLGLASNRYSHFISNISTDTKNDHVFLYVHLLVMTIYASDNQDSRGFPRFYARFHENMKEFTKKAFYLNGVKYGDVQNNLVFNTMDDDEDQPYNYTPTDSERQEAIGRLAECHLDMMKTNNTFTAPLK